MSRFALMALDMSLDMKKERNRIPVAQYHFVAADILDAAETIGGFAFPAVTCGELERLRIEHVSFVPGDLFNQMNEIDGIELDPKKYLFFICNAAIILPELMPGRRTA